MAIDSTAHQAGAAAPRPEGFSYYVSKLIVDAVLFGVISALLSSPLPLLIGAILFLTNDGFIAWLLRPVGIKLVPDSLGANFISAFVFLYVSWTLLTHWKNSLPAWLSAWLPPNFSWTFVIGGALGAALLACVVAGVTRLLSWTGIDVRPDSVTGATVRAVIAFGILGLLYLLLSSPTVEAWFSVP